MYSMYTYGALKEAQLFEMLSLISNNQTCSVVQNYAQTAQSNYRNLVNFEIRFLLHFISKEEDTVVFTHEGVSCIPLMSRGFGVTDFHSRLHLVSLLLVLGTARVQFLAVRVRHYHTLGYPKGKRRALLYSCRTTIELSW